MTNQSFSPPLKSIAAALWFSILLGPIGLLYSSFWGGILMISLAGMVYTGNQISLLIVAWIVSIIWCVGAAENYNRKIVDRMLSLRATSNDAAIQS